MTKQDIHDIRARQREPFNVFENPTQAHRDIAALLAHADTLKAHADAMAEALGGTVEDLKFDAHGNTIYGASSLQSVMIANRALDAYRKWLEEGK